MAECLVELRLRRYAVVAGSVIRRSRDAANVRTGVDDFLRFVALAASETKSVSSPTPQIRVQVGLTTNKIAAALVLG